MPSWKTSILGLKAHKCMGPGKNTAVTNSQPGSLQQSYGRNTIGHHQQHKQVVRLDKL